MKSLINVLDAMKEFFQRKNVHSPRRKAEEIISIALGVNRMQLYLNFDRPLNEEELEKCRTYMQRSVKGEPLQYIAGSVDFYNGIFKVAKGVLIPRPETEELVDKIVQRLKNEDLSQKVLWDICTGSGCIGISLKKRFPELTVYLSDFSEEALAIAQENSVQNGVDVVCLQGDLFTPFQGKKCHYLVSNPPYVSLQEYASLESEVRDYEPKAALLAGERGLDFYERFSREMKNYLYPGGKAWFEIGYTQGEGVKNLFLGRPWAHQKVERDLSGKDRFFSLEIE